MKLLKLLKKLFTFYPAPPLNEKEEWLMVTICVVTYFIGHLSLLAYVYLTR